jgi:hypothetical protein
MCRLLFRGRARKPRALLTGLSVAGDPGVALAWAGAVWGNVGVETAAIFCCATAAPLHVLAPLVFGAARTLLPASVQHQDGGTYTGEWQAQGKHGLGVYRCRSRACLPGL